MYIDNEIKMIRITWDEIMHHAYERVSRSKWKIKLNYACGAEMFLENQPDDLIQCLVLGAYNSGKDIKMNIGDISRDANNTAAPLASFRSLQELILEVSVS